MSIVTQNVMYTKWFGLMICRNGSYIAKDPEGLDSDRWIPLRGGARIPLGLWIPLRGGATIPLGLKPSRDSRATSQRDSPIWIQPLGVFRINHTPGSQMSKNCAIIILFVVPLTTFYWSRAQRSEVYKRDVFVTSWRFHNRAWQPQRHNRLSRHPGHCESTEGLWPISDAH